MAEPAPSVDGALEYLGADESEQDTVESAFDTEKSAQAQLCSIPVGAEPWPPALIEALYRRVAVNLAMRGIPLAYQTAMTEMSVATVRVGGRDPEVERLEGPWRRVVFA